MESKFYVGQKLVVTSDIERTKHWSAEPRLWRGKRVTVESVEGLGSCRLEEVGYSWGVNDFAWNPKEMLQSGSKVTYRDGTERFVLLEVEGLYDENGDKMAHLDYFDDNLLGHTLRDMDIMKIEHCGEIIWERQPEVKVVKMTMKEIAEKLGLDSDTQLDIIEEV